MVNELNKLIIYLSDFILIFEGIALAYYSIDYYLQIKATWRWIKIFYAVSGIIWAILSTLSLFSLWGWFYSKGEAPPWLIPPAFTRPLIVFTLGVMLSGSYYSRGRYKNEHKSK